MDKKNEDKLIEEIDKDFRDRLMHEENIVEAVLFSMGRSVGLDELSTALGISHNATLKAVKRLMDRYEMNGPGLEIIKLEDRYQMRVRPVYYESLIKLMKNPPKPVLTEVLMETLAIIAYREPVTKAEIEKIRGVKSDHAVNKLISYDLVYEMGRLDAPGKPAIFGVSENFLKHFGISSKDDLPMLSPQISAKIESEVQEEIEEIMKDKDKEGEEDE